MCSSLILKSLEDLGCSQSMSYRVLTILLAIDESHTLLTSLGSSIYWRYKSMSNRLKRNTTCNLNRSKRILNYIEVCATSEGIIP